KRKSPDHWGGGRFHPNHFIPFSGMHPDSKTGGGIQVGIYGLLPLWGHGTPGWVKRGFLSKGHLIFPSFQIRGKSCKFTFSGSASVGEVIILIPLFLPPVKPGGYPEVGCAVKPV